MARCARLAAVLLLVCCLGGCLEPVGGVGKACGFEFDPPAPTVDSDRWVVQNVPVSCDQVPQSHILSVYLDYQPAPGTSWQQMDFRFSETAPDAAGFTVTVRGDCFTGLLRARAHAEGISGDGIPFTFDDTSAETPIRIMAASHCERGDP